MKKIMLFTLIILSFNSFSQNSNFSILGRWANGTCNSVLIENNTAYIGNGANLTILDISIPDSPQTIANILFPYMVNGVTVKDSIAYVTTTYGGGLYIVDISDPQNPLHLGELKDISYGLKSVFKNGFLYVQSDQLSIIDVSTPSSPTIIGSMYATEYSDFFIEGDYAFVAYKENGMVIYDISDPAKPTRKSFIQNDYYIRSVAVKDNYAFVGEGGNLRVFDISDISTPKDTADVPGVIDNIVIIGDTLYSVNNYGGMSIYNVSNPLNPILTGTLPSRYFSGASGLAIKGTLIYVAEPGKGLHILDASKHESLVDIGKYITASYFSDMLFVEDLLFVSDITNGLFIFDVSNNSSPTRISITTPLDDNFKNLAKKGNLIFLGAYTGIYIIDVSDPLNPSVLSKLDIIGVQNLKVSGNYLYAASHNANGFTIFDISDPTNPQEKGSLAGAAWHMTVDGDYAYVVPSNENGFNIVDITDPMNPTIKSYSELQSINYYRDIVVSGNYAYAVGHGLNIIDISDPVNPTVVGIMRGSSFSSVSVVGDDAYISHEKGIMAVNINDRTNPILAHKLETPNSFVSKLCTNQSIIYFNQLYNGTYVLRNDWPTNTNIQEQHSEIELFQNYPNPFKKITTIDYYLQVAGNVNLSIFDVSGKEIEVLENAYKIAGKHSLSWSPGKSSGHELFYRLKVNNMFVQTKKMIVR